MNYDEESREEQYELDAVMIQLQSDWKRLRSTHQKFILAFKDELEAVIRASDNILPEGMPDLTICGDLEISLLTGRATWKEQVVHLAHTELKIVSTLSSRPNQLYSRDFLMAAFVDDRGGSSDRLIDSHIKRIRRKFETVDPTFDRIFTMYGAGYRWNP